MILDIFDHSSQEKGFFLFIPKTMIFNFEKKGDYDNAPFPFHTKLHAVCERTCAQIDKIETEEDIDKIAKLYKIK